MCDWKFRCTHPTGSQQLHPQTTRIISVPSYKSKLDMLRARRHLKSPRSLSGPSAHPTMVTLVNIMVMNGWLRSFSFHVNRPPHSWGNAISDSDLETPRSMSWLWSEGKIIQSAQYHINSLPFHFTPIRPTIPEIELFRNLTSEHPRSRSWARLKVKVTYCTQYPTNTLPYRFTSPKSNQVITMTATLCSDLKSGSHFIAQTSKFLIIDATAVTLAQGNGKVIQYIFPYPYIFVPNI